MPAQNLLSSSNPSLETLLLCRKQDKISTELDNETVILDMESGIYSGLDSVGTSIWKLLEHEISFADLRQALMEEYDVEKDTCETDILIFLNKLAADKLINVT